MLHLAILLRPSVIALAASAIALAGCQQDEPSDAASSAPPAPATPVIAIAPAPILDRAGLLQLMDLAASTYAKGGGVDDASLVGRRFVVRQAFGCNTPASPGETTAPDDGLAISTRGPGGRTLKLALTPGDWTASPPFANAAGAWEAAEGFWLSWPWLRADGCPNIPDDGSAVVEPTAGETRSPQTVGLAAVFHEGGSRLGRRNGRAYEFAVRGEGGQPPITSAAGFRLVLEGRFVAFDDGRAIRCRASGPDQRPVCIGAVQLERVAFETAEGQIFVEWRV
ncbi:MAG: hypothetical protein ACREEY_04355 [Brevundimonas sp.]